MFSYRSIELYSLDFFGDSNKVSPAAVIPPVTKMSAAFGDLATSSSGRSDPLLS
jgi:hypothetical protein